MAYNDKHKYFYGETHVLFRRKYQQKQLNRRILVLTFKLFHQQLNQQWNDHMETLKKSSCLLDYIVMCADL